VKDISLHVLDVVENSIRAEAKLVEVRVTENRKENVLTVEIRDNGRGMASEETERCTDPFFTTKDDRKTGLGLSLLAQAAREAGGDMDIVSGPRTGTRITARFMYNHPDRKPIGDMQATLQSLIVGNPDVDFVYRHMRDNETMSLDTRQLRQ
jgi:signal transduction histidine kinase